MSDEVPLWAALLSAASGDPLRAQEMEAHLSAEWYARWQCWVEERNAST